MHLQSYSRKANPRGQSVEQVLAEAARAPIYSKHVVEPRLPSVVYGVAADEVRKLHDQMVSAGGVDVTLKDGQKARRGIRKDRHTLMACGLTRTGPKRERLSRQQWKARKDQARRDAKLQSAIEKRVERIVKAFRY